MWYEVHSYNELALIWSKCARAHSQQMNVLACSTPKINDFQEKNKDRERSMSQCKLVQNHSICNLKIELTMKQGSGVNNHFGTWIFCALLNWMFCLMCTLFNQMTFHSHLTVSFFRCKWFSGVRAYSMSSLTFKLH